MAGIASLMAGIASLLLASLHEGVLHTMRGSERTI
jgi:hypothetical protein